MKNRLGLPVSVRHSEMFCPIGQQSTNLTVTMQDGETLGMDYSTTTDSDQFSAMISLSAKDYYIQPSKLTYINSHTVYAHESLSLAAISQLHITANRLQNTQFLFLSWCLSWTPYALWSTVMHYISTCFEVHWEFKIQEKMSAFSSIKNMM